MSLASSILTSRNLPNRQREGRSARRDNKGMGMVQVQSISDTGTSEGGADWMGCAYNSTFMVWVSGLSNQLNHVSFTVKLSLRYTILQIWKVYIYHENVRNVCKLTKSPTLQHSNRWQAAETKGIPNLHEVGHTSHVKYLIRASTSAGHGLCFEVNIVLNWISLLRFLFLF